MAARSNRNNARRAKVLQALGRIGELGTGAGYGAATSKRLIAEARAKGWLAPGFLQNPAIERNFSAVAGATPPAVGAGPGTGYDPNNPQSLPYDALYEDAVARRQRNLTNTMGQLQFEETDLNQTYNDPSNPFNQLAMAKRAFEQQKRGATNSMAARGQLYSGALQNQQNEIRFGHERTNDDLARAYARARQGIVARRQGAQSEFEDYKASAYADRLARASQGGY